MLRLLSLILVLSSFQAIAGQKTTIYNITGRVASEGFYDSSFDDKEPKKKFCYSGNIKGVCAQIYEYAYDMQSEYAGGAHDTVEVLKCRIKNRAVLVSLHLEDDYSGDIINNYSIAKCK